MTMRKDINWQRFAHKSTRSPQPILALLREDLAKLLSLMHTKVEENKKIKHPALLGHL